MVILIVKLSQDYPIWIWRYW